MTAPVENSGSPARLPVAAVANHFVELAGRSGATVTPLQLQKILYFAHGWHLALRDAPLLDERVEAWKYGPVIPSVYRHFKHFGNRGIDRPATEYDPATRAWAVPRIPADDWLRAFLSRIWEVYSRYSGGQLVALTHSAGAPWEVTVAAMGGAFVRGTDIDDRLIRDYFLRRLNR